MRYEVWGRKYIATGNVKAYRRKGDLEIERSEIPQGGTKRHFVA
jgi:hypothetical protein